MKKFLAIIVLGLFWCNAGFAELIELNKCFAKKPSNVNVDLVIWSSWDEYNKGISHIYEGPKFEDVIFENLSKEIFFNFDKKLTV